VRVFAFALTIPIHMAVSRVRGRALQAIRRRHLSANPLCVLCLALGKLSPATDLDHIIALVNGGTNADSNYQCLCKACHQDKTARDLGLTVRVSTGLDGWPL
jgi:5-methylcytosine-specific restriction protein A